MKLRVPSNPYLREKYPALRGDAAKLPQSALTTMACWQENHAINAEGDPQSAGKYGSLHVTAKSFTQMHMRKLQAFVATATSRAKPEEPRHAEWRVNITGQIASSNQRYFRSSSLTSCHR
jgi:hypothetical protein